MCVLCVLKSWRQTTGLVRPLVPGTGVNRSSLNVFEARWGDQRVDLFSIFRIMGVNIGHL